MERRPGAKVSRGALADQRVMQRKRWRDLCKLLAAGEAMLRHVLLVLALWKPKEGGYETKSRRKLRAGGGGPGGSSAYLTGAGIDPAIWRVRFTLQSIAASLRKKAAAKPAPIKAPSCFIQTLSCAERLEKILRVLENPEPYAKRLRARLLSTLFAPEATPEATKRAAQMLVMRLMKRPKNSWESVDRSLDRILPHAADAGWPFCASG